MFRLFLALILLTIFVGCEKKIKDIEPLFKYQNFENGKVQFTAEAKHATAYEWVFGDGETSTEENPLHQYKKNGKYIVVMIAKNKRNQVTKVYEVLVENAPKPVVKFAYKSEGNGVIQFTNQSENAESFKWEFGNGSSSETAEPKYTFVANGTYVVKLTGKNYNGSSEITQNVTIADAPRPAAQFSFSYGYSGSVVFSNQSVNADTYNWSFGDGGTSASHDPEYTYTKNGNYNVVLTARGKNGESTSTQTVTISNIYTPANGNIIFYTTFSGPNIKITVNGAYKGLITKYVTSSSAPGCGSEGFVTVTLPEGAYSFKAEEDSPSGSTWTGMINISNGVCKAMRLTK